MRRSRKRRPGLVAAYAQSRTQGATAHSAKIKICVPVPNGQSRGCQWLASAKLPKPQRIKVLTDQPNRMIGGDINGKLRLETWKTRPRTPIAMLIGL